ncbi:sensor domain-containing protein [Actinoplanes sp. NPDC023714]|uniref:sensor domain-containing protein n=1 Tax=Actinoplanes sp. NPDC023714 TaxID=3154322 RepID=UPI003407F245
MTTIDAPLVSTSTFARLTADTRYVLTGFPIALAGTVIATTGVSLGAGLAVLWIGVPILVATMMFARGLAVTERRRIGTTPFPYRGATADTVLSRVVAVVRDPQSWRDLLHTTFRIIPSTVAFSVVVSWWAAVVGGVSWALWGWSLPESGMELPELLGFGDGYLTIVSWYLVIAAAFALTLPTVTRWAAGLEARFARALL